MDTKKLDFKASARQLMSTGVGLSGDHFSLEELEAYHHGRAGTRESQIQHHLIFCRECRQQLLELANFLDDLGGVERFSSDELLEAWRSLNEALVAQSA